MKVTLYGATWCAFCKTEKQWLDSKDVSYEYKEVDTDESAMKELEALEVGNSVPVTVVDDGKSPIVIRGFDRHSLGHAIGI